MFRSFVFGLVLATVIVHPANAGRITRPLGELNAEIASCVQGQKALENWVMATEKDLWSQSNDRSPATGTLTGASMRLWMQDATAIWSWYYHEINKVTHKETLNREDCRQVIEKFTGCFVELRDNVSAVNTVPVPTTGCLGELYRRYDLHNSDHEYGQ